MRYLAHVAGTIRSDEIGDPSAVPTPCPSTPVITFESPVAMAPGQTADVVLRVTVTATI